MKLFLIFVILSCFAVSSYTAAVGNPSTDLADDNKNIEVSELKAEFY